MALSSCAKAKGMVPSAAPAKTPGGPAKLPRAAPVNGPTLIASPRISTPFRRADSIASFHAPGFLGMFCAASLASMNGMRLLIAPGIF